jgi:hypothetical protein
MKIWPYLFCIEYNLIYMKRNFQVFISHSRHDRKAAERVAKVIRDEGYDAWWDEEIRPGSNWAEGIAEALNRSQAIVMLISPDFIKSDWAQKEIEYALSGEKFNRRVIPVLLKPTAQFPWILDRLNVIDASGDFDKAARQIVKALQTATMESKQ